jgi:hypothetical protein
MVLAFGEADSSVDLLQLSERTQGIEPAEFALGTLVTYGRDVDTTDSRVHVELAWGNPRAELRAILDAGQTVNLAANYLRATARTFGAVGASGGADISINVARALAQPPTRPRLTDRRISAVAAAATVGPFVVPPFARRVALATDFDPTLGPNPILAQWFTRQPAAALFAQAQLGGAVASQFGWTWTPVPSGAGAMFVTNGPAITSIQPIWELAL